MVPETTLVILSPAFPKDESEENWVPAQQMLVKELKKQFPQTKIMVLSFLYPYESMIYRWNGVDVVAFGGMKMKKFKKFLLWKKIWDHLKGIRSSNHIIGLFSFWCAECALIGHYFGKFYRIQHYSWICGQDARKMNRLVRFIRPKANELVAISHFVREEFHRSHGIRPAHFIPIAIDPKMFPEKFPVNRSIDILAAGNLVPLKQYDIFIGIVNRLKKKMPALNVVLCGHGAEEEKLRALAKKHELEDTIEFKGMILHSELLALMQHARVFVHPSSYEGFGAVCMEALYAGAHVVSFCQPINDPVENWHIVKTADEMISKTCELLSDPYLEFKPVPLFTIDKTASQVMQLFNDDRDSSFFNSSKADRNTISGEYLERQKTLPNLQVSSMQLPHSRSVESKKEL